MTTPTEAFEDLIRTREGRKLMTFAMRYGANPNEDPETNALARFRAWQWVDDPTKPL